MGVILFTPASTPPPVVARLNAAFNAAAASPSARGRLAGLSLELVGGTTEAAAARPPIRVPVPGRATTAPSPARLLGGVLCVPSGRIPARVAERRSSTAEATARRASAPATGMSSGQRGDGRHLRALGRLGKAGACGAALVAEQRAATGGGGGALAFAVECGEGRGQWHARGGRPLPNDRRSAQRLTLSARRF